MSAVLSKHTIAVFSDIHSNYHAFKACFEDAVAHGAECFIFLGDYVSDLAEPRKTMDLVYQIKSQYPTFCLRGNREGYMLECRSGKTAFAPGSKTGSLLYTYQHLRTQDLDFFEGLPISDEIELYGIQFEIAHADIDHDRRLYYADDPYIETVMAQMRTPFLLTGHSHTQYLKSNQGKTVINPGSIGVPRGYGSLSQYALLNIEDGDVRCQFRQLPYDLKAAIHSQFGSGLAELAKYWAIGVLHDVITGEEYAVRLLERVFQIADGAESAVHDEALWQRAADEMGMKSTEGEIVALISDR